MTYSDKENLPYLKSLIVSQGQLNPAFHPSQTTYNIYVGHETTIITVEAVAAHCKCQARFGTKLGRSGSAWKSIQCIFIYKTMCALFL